MSIQVSQINKRFGNFVALDDVSLDFKAGELVALLGPSGCGKTTLLRIIAGLEQADNGNVILEGEDASQRHVRERQVGFVFQHYALFRHMSVFENIAFGLKVRSRRDRPAPEAIRERVHELLKLVQLDGLDGRYPNQLSGGQRQRVALARALAVEPRVLLLDEPFGALDAKVRKELRRWLRHFHEQVHLTTLFVTHDQEEALEIADEVVIMNQARIEQVGTPQQVYDRPATPFVYQFLGNVNVLRAQSLVDAGIGWNRESVMQAGGSVYVRPHDVEVARHSPSAHGIPAVLRFVHAAGPQARLTLEQVRSREMVDVEVSRAELAALGLKVGDLATLRLRQGVAGGEDYAI